MVGKKYDKCDGGFYKIQGQILKLDDCVTHNHSFLNVEFDDMVNCRLEGALHSQLVNFAFNPVNSSVFSLGKLEGKTEFDFKNCNTFEEYLSRIIQDKPSNIDTFFDTIVKQLIVSYRSLVAYITWLYELTTDESLASNIRALL